MSLSTSHDSAAKADQIAHKFFAKVALVLHHARATPHTPGPRLDKWFNLETPDTDAFREPLRAYRSLSAAAPPPPLELHVLLAVPELATNQVLVLAEPHRPRARVDPTPRHVLLESWLVVFAPDSAARGPAPDRPDVALSSVYKQSISVFRSMFTLLRVLPAWRLLKRLRRGAGAGPAASQLAIRVCVADPAADVLHFGAPVAASAPALPTHRHAFPPVAHPLGTLSISTTYLLAPAFHIDTLESLLSSRFLSQDASFTPTLAARQQHASRSGSPLRTSLPRSPPPGPSLADRFVLPASGSASAGSASARPASADSASPADAAPAPPAAAGPQPIRRPSAHALHPFKAATLSGAPLHSPSASASAHRHSPLPARPPSTRLSSSPGARPPASPGAPRPTYPPERPKRYSSSFGHRYADGAGGASPGRERPASASFLGTTADDDDILAFVQAIKARAPLRAKAGAGAEPGAEEGVARTYRAHVDAELRRMNDAFAQSLAGLEGRRRRSGGAAARPAFGGGGGSASGSGSASASASGSGPAPAHDRDRDHRRTGSAASGSDEIIGRLEFDDPARAFR